jgi:hypothetical protein
MAILIRDGARGAPERAEPSMAGVSKLGTLIPFTRTCKWAVAGACHG